LFNNFLNKDVGKYWEIELDFNIRKAMLQMIEKIAHRKMLGDLRK